MIAGDEILVTKIDPRDQIRDRRQTTVVLIYFQLVLERRSDVRVLVPVTADNDDVAMMIRDGHRWWFGIATLNLSPYQRQGES